MIPTCPNKKCKRYGQPLENIYNDKWRCWGGCGSWFILKNGKLRKRELGDE